MKSNTRMASLENQLQELDAEIQTREKDRSLRIGLFGVPGAGKSSLLAAWYLFRTDRRYGMDLSPDEQSLVCLRTIAENVLNEGQTRATPVATPDAIRFRINVENELWEVETMDFAGSLLLPTKDREALKSADACRKFLKTCDVVLCLFYWKESTLDTLDALDVCLREYKSSVILALTKFDETGIELHSNADFAEVVSNLRSENRTFADLWDRIQRTFNRFGRVSIIPLSPLGGDFSSLPNGSYPLTREKLKPLNVYKPLSIAIEQKKQTLCDLRRKRSRVDNELKEYHAARALANAEQRRAEVEQEEMRNRALNEAREQLNELKTRVAASGDLPGELFEASFDDCINEAKRMEQVFRSLEDRQLLREAKEFPRWLDGQRKERATRIEIAQLEKRYSEIEEQVTEGLDAGLLEWMAASISKWRAKLVEIEKKAESLGHDGLSGSCQRLTSQIRRRQLRNRVMVFVVTVVAVSAGFAYLEFAHHLSW
jgi:GTPase SAR1 family protein